MQLKNYTQNISKNIKQIHKNIAEIEDKVIKLKEIQASFIKIDKQ